MEISVRKVPEKGIFRLCKATCYYFNTYPQPGRTDALIHLSLTALFMWPARASCKLLAVFTLVSMLLAKQCSLDMNIFAGTKSIRLLI